MHVVLSAAALELHSSAVELDDRLQENLLRQTSQVSWRLPKKNGVFYEVVVQTEVGNVTADALGFSSTEGH
jgi:hypothetical protein